MMLTVNQVCKLCCEEAGIKYVKQEMRKRSGQMMMMNKIHLLTKQNLMALPMDLTMPISDHMMVMSQVTWGMCHMPMSLKLQMKEVVMTLKEHRIVNQQLKRVVGVSRGVIKQFRSLLQKRKR